MTSIYMPVRADGFELCRPVYHRDAESIERQINGKNRKPTWQPIMVRLIQEEAGERFLPSDSPWLGAHALVFRPVALDALGPTLYRFGERLPLACAQDDLVVFNPTRVVDGLDENASVVQRYRDGRILEVIKYAFRTRAIIGLDVFKLSCLQVSPTFVSDRVVDRWKRAGLKGLEFQEVWASA